MATCSHCQQGGRLGAAGGSWHSGSWHSSGVMHTEANLEAWLSNAINHERTGTFRDIRIERFRAFLALLPTPPAPCTVGGTKGKGSTVRLIEAAVRAHGRHTVAFTSPHVRTVRERWRIDGIPAAIEQLTPAAQQVAAVEADHAFTLTYFERTAAMAVIVAASIPQCVLLWEVGLGGRLDCANALDCQVAVLTHLSHDHRDILGPTLSDIAAEKLPIARAGRPLLVAPQSAAGEEAWRWAMAQSPVAASVQWIARHPQPFDLALPGDHQQDNASTALAATKILIPEFQESVARRGMASATLAARCQLVTRGRQRILVDGAHNGPSIAATVAVAHANLRPGWRLILGTATDKEIEEMAAELLPQLTVYRCGYDSPRARSQAQWPSALLTTRWYPDVATALRELSAESTDDLCITGSFYVAGEALIALGVTDALDG